MRKLQVKVSEDELGALHERADAAGVSLSNLVRDALGLGRKLPGRPKSSGAKVQVRADRVHGPPAAAPRPLPDARWISQRSQGEVSYSAAQAALDEGSVEWTGQRISVSGRVF